MPSGRSFASAWVERLQLLTALAACGILLFVPFSLSVANICMVVAAIAWCALRLLPHNQPRTPPPPLVRCWLWFIAAGALSCLNTLYPAESLRGLVKLGKAFLIYAVGVELGRTARGPLWLTRSAWVAVVLSAVDGLWQRITGRDLVQGIAVHIALGDFPRITAGFRDPNNFGMFLALTLPLCYLYARWIGLRRWRVLAWAGVALGAAALFFTYSRGAALGLLAGLALVCAVRRDYRLAGLTAAAAGLAYCCLPHSAFHWITTSRSPLVALTNEDRLQMWQAAWRMIRVHPFLGVGVGTFARRYAEFKLPDDPLIASYAHNTFLQLWAVMGLNGLLAFCCLCWRGGSLWRASFVQATHADHRSTAALVGLGCLAGALAFLVHGLFESNLSSSKLSMLFWLFGGVAMGIATTRALKHATASV